MYQQIIKLKKFLVLEARIVWILIIYITILWFKIA